MICYLAVTDTIRAAMLMQAGIHHIFVQNSSFI
nr:MAG TPA: hypothetical protein [Caudoviricetes sp.]